MEGTIKQSQAFENITYMAMKFGNWCEFNYFLHKLLDNRFIQNLAWGNHVLWKSK